MSYTVKQLAEMSGVSVRTLHWYDEKDLLKPAYYGENGYRYYEEKELLILQQILFFKELGFCLDQIQKLLTQKGFNKILTLQSHKKALSKDISHKKELIKTIDKTIAHLKGEVKMQDQELYKGFDPNKQKEYEQYIVKEYGLEAEKRLKESHKRTAKWDKNTWDEVKNLGDQIHKELAKAIESNFSPESNHTQAIIKRHYELQNRFYDLTKEIYIGLTELYEAHPDFRKFFEVYHPEMIEYLGKAMRYYTKQHL